MLFLKTKDDWIVACWRIPKCILSRQMPRRYLRFCEMHTPMMDDFQKEASAYPYGGNPPESLPSNGRPLDIRWKAGFRLWDGPSDNIIFIVHNEGSDEWRRTSAHAQQWKRPSAHEITLRNSAHDEIIFWRVNTGWMLSSMVHSMITTRLPSSRTYQGNRKHNFTVSWNCKL